MKIFFALLTVGIGLAVVGPALAADQVATGKPMQLSQQPAHKAKQARKEAKKDVRGKARATEAGAMAKVKP